MASGMTDTEPLCDVSILKTKRVLLVENIKFENVMPSIKPFLIPRQIDTINAEKSGFDRIGKILDYIERLAQGSQYGGFNSLMKAIGGTQPELFTTLLGRLPSETETAFCVNDVVQGVKDVIIQTGHCTDSKLDEKICLEYEHVELSMVDTSGSEADHKVPHVYGDHLTQLERKGRNISACDILSSESKQNEMTNEKVLVFGRPGVGKSTTTQWLARQWALEKWATGVTLLFLLQVRLLTNVDVPITVLHLLTLYSLYQLEDMADSLVLSSWLKNPASKILIFADGLDEIPGFADRMINTRRIRDLTHKAHPIDLLVNILRGDLLPHSIVISASRPFLGLSELKVVSKAEILGLTSRKVTEYVQRKYSIKANQILSVLNKSPILLSVCGITFYCMLISRLLSEGVILVDEEVQTYTRLMAFILVQYVSRKMTGSDFSLETSPYLVKLASLAHSGIFHSQESTKLAKLVFDNKDLINAKLTIEDLNHLKKTGIIQIREHQIGGCKSILIEYFHLSGQEMLAVLYFISRSQYSDDVLHQLFSGGHFDMALMYTFGLHFDRTNKWVDKLWAAMGSLGPGFDLSITSQLPGPGVDTSITSQLPCPGVDTSITSQLPGPSVDTSFTSQLPGPGVDTSITSQLPCPGVDTSITSQLPDPSVDTSFTSQLPCPGVDTSITSQLPDPSVDTSISLEPSGPRADRADNSEPFLSRMRTWINRIKAALCSSGSDAETLTTSQLPGPGVDTSITSQLPGPDVDTSITSQLPGPGVDTSITSQLPGPSVDTSITSQLSSFIDRLWKEKGSKMKACQLVYEGQWVDKAKEVFGHIAPNGQLSLEYTPMTAIDLLAVNFVCRCGGSLSSVTLNNVNADATFVKVMMSSLVENSLSALQVLNLTGNTIGADGVIAIADYLSTGVHDTEPCRAAPSLTTLNISDNELGPEGAQAVAVLLKSNTGLTSLDISDNNIQGDGAKALAEALVTNTSLTELNIEGNEIGAVGAQALGEALVSNTSLTEFNILDNEIGEVGAKAICEALVSNTSLTKLDISSNKIGDVGAEAVRDMLKLNTRLQKLYMCSNRIGNRGAEVMTAGLYKNTSLTELDIGGNYMGPTGVKVLTDVMKHRPTLTIDA